MRRHDVEVIGGLIFFALILAIIIGVAVAKTGTGRIETATVESKERVCDSSRSCRYLIFTDRGVYENTDAWLSLKFDSSDIYGAIKPGRTYRLKVNGWRVEVTSSYPNILSIEGEVTK
ncbi:hypothetical protein HD597_006797 [Nonomuraea thailandensis]|uniref:Uncharacterized protein n=1 Tax=Nonomuraea thailandensis TaxID=1188745 RepID=A0A9X2GK83_9ACTN|nr:DUF1523 family protein [Nonomuraea thailandensis]MCP2359777.1 hypothetical protein [Nonomuraea thailandensis]